MSEYTIYWGEAHDNTYQFDENPVSFQEVLRRAASHLDFYAAAYYTACAAAFQPGGHITESHGPTDLPLEGWKDPRRLEQEWQEVQAETRKMNDPGNFITFPGYEWQGNGSSGDHNVFFLREGGTIHRVDTLKELYTCLHGQDAIAIPHHTAYRPGRRGRDWSVYDPVLTPFCEVFSIHGCSETDEEWVGLRQNHHMGPGQAGGTYQEALERGYRLGAICSTDNWGDMPGRYGNGRMACLAQDLTRADLWEAFRQRRVYGVTGDRIRLDFAVNESPMGSILSLPSSAKRRIRVAVCGSDAIDRIEILKGSRLFATHCHQGSWELPEPGRRARFKLRLEFGWGPSESELCVPDRVWQAAMRLQSGRIIGFEPCWISPGHSRPCIRPREVTFEAITTSQTAAQNPQNSNVFEIECDPAEQITIEINGLRQSFSMIDLCSGSRLLWFRDECIRMLADFADIAPGSPERDDIYWHVAYKAKLHRAMPESAYSTVYETEDDTPLSSETYYRVRVEQRNGQRAWSSPIWVRPE